MSEDEVFDVNEAAAFAKVSHPIIRRAVVAHESGEPGLRAGRVGERGDIRVTKRVLLDWIDAGMPGTDRVVDDDKKGGAD